MSLEFPILLRSHLTMRLLSRELKNTAEFFDYKLKLEDKVAEQTNVLRKAYRTLQIQAEYLQKKNQQIIEMLGTVVEYRSTEVESYPSE